MMSLHARSPFDFDRHAAGQPDFLPLIRAFAAAGTYRSATVEELELPEDSFRRPLRPEDLEFLTFKRAVRPHTVHLLPSLATQRLLFCINELSVVRLPAPGAMHDFTEMHDPAVAGLAARIRPYLQAYGFDFASREADALAADADAVALLGEQAVAHGRLIELLLARDYLRQGAGFVTAQFVPLFDMQARALDAATAFGFLDILPVTARPALAGSRLVNRLLEVMKTGSSTHAHWQFYSAGSLARPNLLWAYATSPGSAFGALGAFFAAEAEWGGFLCFAGRALDALGETNESEAGGDLAGLDMRFGAAREILKTHWGADAITAFEHGFATACAVFRAAMRDLTEQLTWLSDMEAYLRAAAVLERRIERDDPCIDRDTFVEPREMCSTTHVHNDHRLVVIEQGDMIFWGTPGMSLGLHPGDRVLIPAGRLHGSTVTSEECTYHQPIIPDNWVIEALDEVARAQGNQRTAIP